MNILFATLSNITDIKEHGIYEDLLREFFKNGHKIYVISPIQKGDQATHLLNYNDCTILRVRTGNIAKNHNLIKKGISTLLLERQFISAIKKNFNNIKFDLILYTTPPITLVGVVDYIKKKDGAKSYLLLKDIFPQNAVDIGMMNKNGLKGFIYKYFRKKEKRLYEISDYIGCMSQANVDYILKHNPEIDTSKVEVCPNSVDPIDRSVSNEERISIRKKYDIPLDKTIFVYGGNFGKPQGIPFLIECLKSQKDNDEAFFLLVGAGTEFNKLEDFISTYQPQNIKLMSYLPKEDYDSMVGSCDVGMIFLDHRFTIPNFPSRLLSYMQAKIPVLAVTDPNTDIGKVIVDGGFGWWCESDDLNKFNKIITEIVSVPLKVYGKRAWNYLNSHFNVNDSYRIIKKRIV